MNSLILTPTGRKYQGKQSELTILATGLVKGNLSILICVRVCVCVCVWIDR